MTNLKQYLMGREVKFPITKEQEDNTNVKGLSCKRLRDKGQAREH